MAVDRVLRVAVVNKDRSGVLVVGIHHLYQEWAVVNSSARDQGLGLFSQPFFGSRGIHSFRNNRTNSCEILVNLFGTTIEINDPCTQGLL